MTDQPDHDRRVTPVAPPVELPNLDYDATDYDGLQTEISDGFMGETGDLIRQHAKAVLALRGLTAVPRVKPVPVDDGIKRIDITEFREIGFLQEVNRQFLHPLGLALEVVPEADGTERLGGVRDHRDDPEGMSYEPGILDEDKAERVAEELRKHLDARRKFFHVPSWAQEGWIQPLAPWPTKCIPDDHYHIGPWQHVPHSDSLHRCEACGYVSGK